MVDRSGRSHPRTVREYGRIHRRGRRRAVRATDDLASNGIRGRRSILPSRAGRLSTDQHEQHGGAIKIANCELQIANRRSRSRSRHRAACRPRRSRADREDRRRRHAAHGHPQRGRAQQRDGTGPCPSRSREPRRRSSAHRHSRDHSHDDRDSRRVADYSHRRPLRSHVARDAQRVDRRRHECSDRRRRCCGPSAAVGRGAR